MVDSVTIRLYNNDMNKKTSNNRTAVGDYKAVQFTFYGMKLQHNTGNKGGRLARFQLLDSAKIHNQQLGSSGAAALPALLV